MSSPRRIVLAVLPLVAIIAGFWFGLLAPKRAQTGAVKTQIALAESRRDAALAVAAQARQARAQYRRDHLTVARLGKAVPSDDGVASLVHQLDVLARANKIDFRAVKLTGAAAGAPAPGAAKPAAEADAKDSKDKPAAEAAAGGPKDKPAAQPGAAGAPAAPAAPLVAQPPPGAAVGAAGLLTMPFSLTFDGGYLEMQRFLKAIEGLATSKNGTIAVHGRLLTVDGFSLAAGRKGFPKVKALVSATAYIAPEPEAAAAGVTPQPGAVATATAAPAAATPPQRAEQ